MIAGQGHLQLWMLLGFADLGDRDIHFPLQHIRRGLLASPKFARKSLENFNR
jgi:hypothetical protein